MAPYQVKIASAAQKQIHALEIKQQKSVIQLIEALTVNPRPPGANKITGMIGLYSATIESARIIYKIEEQEVLLLLVRG
ncbi:MAG: hypothetical protein A3F43_00930 [Gammaproteobacteria bacterium RIFCSPHIGHO2_12_FULL_42_10]|nr:MAG: hypothetical protein A3F43_00930 [Gammaproteobacteria bacterium RIFCSPHIGHO2_12_FULL_42_10]